MFTGKMSRMLLLVSLSCFLMMFTTNSFARALAETQVMSGEVTDFDGSSIVLDNTVLFKSSDSITVSSEDLIGKFVYIKYYINVDGEFIYVDISSNENFDNDGTVKPSKSSDS